MPRTSLTHPLQIDSVIVTQTGGLIGMTICPGMVQGGPSERAWDRDLNLDLAAIKAWGTTALVTLIEDYELEILSVADLPQKAQAMGLEWYQLPIMNRDAPYEEFEENWIINGRMLRQRLRQGERIVLHCVFGLGRSGMIAARLLVELGEQPEAAIRKVRVARPGAIETEIQEQHVFRCCSIKE
jgi:ADP-ribosyl-[dinitrogen reductase] hydrolase